jgi:hypothetical protein
MSVIAVLIQGVWLSVPTAEVSVMVLVGLTVIVIPLDVAGDPVKHGLAFDVNCTVTTSLLFNVVLVNVALVAPDTGVPLIDHWY